MSIRLSLLPYRGKTAAQLLGVPISIAGACVIVMRGSWEAFIGLSLVQGDVWMMVAFIFYASYLVLLHKRPAMNSVSFLTVTFGIGVLPLLALYLWELSWARPTATIANVLLATIDLAVLPSVLAYLSSAPLAVDVPSLPCVPHAGTLALDKESLRPRPRASA